MRVADAGGRGKNLWGCGFCPVIVEMDFVVECAAQCLQLGFLLAHAEELFLQCVSLPQTHCTKGAIQKNRKVRSRGTSVDPVPARECSTPQTLSSEPD